VRRRAPLDELDDPAELDPPPRLPLIRYCGARSCRRRARSGGRHCPACHAAAVRRWRDGHRREINARRRDAADCRSEETRIRDSARAMLAMAIRRGTKVRGCCRFCGASEVIGLMADPAQWNSVEWVCREHRQAEFERRREADAQQVYEDKQAAWIEERARALAAIDLLPPEVRAKFHAAAARGPAGMQLTPEAPLYVMQLVRAYKAFVRQGALLESSP